MTLSKPLRALLIVWLVLLSGILLWGNSPEDFINPQSVLPKEEKILSSSSLGFSNQIIRKGESPPFFPPDLIFIQQAIQSVAQRNIGRMIRAELVIGESATVYEIEVARCDGRITVIEVDAYSGQVLGPLYDLGEDKCPPLSLNYETEI